MLWLGRRRSCLSSPHQSLHPGFAARLQCTLCVDIGVGTAQHSTAQHSISQASMSRMATRRRHWKHPRTSGRGGPVCSTAQCLRTYVFSAQTGSSATVYESIQMQLFSYLQNAMTSSEERPSAEIEVAGCHPERTLTSVGVPSISVLEQILGEKQ